MKEVYVLILCVCFCLNGCFYFGWENAEVKHLTKDFILVWYDEPQYRCILRTQKHREYGGEVIVGESVQELNYDDNFIIAKQKINNREEIIKKLFIWDQNQGAYQIKKAQDTVFLDSEDNLFKVNDKWYHTKGIEDYSLDSLTKDLPQEFYYIIDIRSYGKGWVAGNHIYQYKTKEEFINAKNKIGEELRNMTFDNVFSIE
jgi:lipopolysaccharide export LptBFGC system permease protein LptF